MKTEKKAGMKNEKINPQAEEIADLPVTDEQARQAKGGGQGDRPMESISINFTKI